MIDDGSSDETLSVARSYEARDSRVRVFTQENAGVSAARNHGICEAKGEYMMFLDSDDWLEDDAVEILLHTAMVVFRAATAVRTAFLKSPPLHPPP